MPYIRITGLYLSFQRCGDCIESYTCHQIFEKSKSKIVLEYIPAKLSRAAGG